MKKKSKNHEKIQKENNRKIKKKSENLKKIKKSEKKNSTLKSGFWAYIPWIFFGLSYTGSPEG